MSLDLELQILAPEIGQSIQGRIQEDLYYGLQTVCSWLGYIHPHDVRLRDPLHSSGKIIGKSGGRQQDK